LERKDGAKKKEDLSRKGGGPPSESASLRKKEEDSAGKTGGLISSCPSKGIGRDGDEKRKTIPKAHTLNLSTNKNLLLLKKRKEMSRSEKMRIVVLRGGCQPAGTRKGSAMDKVQLGKQDSFAFLGEGEGL